MGYWITRSLISDNKELLQDILDALNSDQTLELDVPIESLSKMQWGIRNILKSAEAFPSEFGGIFAHLASSVSLKLDYPTGKIRVIPRALAKRGVAPVNDELTAAASLDSYSGDLTRIEFRPSSIYSESGLERALARKGWTLHLSTRIEKEGKISFAVERAQLSDEEIQSNPEVARPRSITAILSRLQSSLPEKGKEGKES